MTDPPEKQIVVKTPEGELFKANIVQFLKGNSLSLVFLEEPADPRQEKVRELQISFSKESLREFRDYLAFQEPGVILIELLEHNKAQTRLLVENEIITLDNRFN